ncbi:MULTISPECIES: DUF502 domain-containing protein [Parachlamydia]|jgi:uncharacterized membrane protein|uniref:DUF502 domain-containing protein n=1 Tax=Parachlamydia acanthamoebae (strain UV7) TaxID=765952 RepID=F8KW82_PARAV|nr:DUF502 domain-containing protein [Parachlamydia acanthamoebae]EFB42737.1 hypothetical protein pah_c003o018 [Parachlamydia acanthamoebae str. Hall's coccus]CCB85877.1 putative uncharacterized protein [Parachlamydia acanthamoebae UV-7]
MKKSFITGLVIILPLATTLFIVAFAFNFLTGPFAGVLYPLFNYYHLFNEGFLFLSAEQTRQYVSQLLVLLFLFSFTLALGAIARWFFVHYLIQFWDLILYRIPIVRTIYKTCQDVMKTIFTSETKSFKQVVMVPFPNPESFALGLVTKEDLPGLGVNQGSTLVAVFIPTTPNPTSGFLLMLKKEDVVYLDMKVEDAFKYIISCGVIQTPFTAIAKDS